MTSHLFLSHLERGDGLFFWYIDIVKLISATLYACRVMYATYGYVNHVAQSKRVVRRTRQTEDSTAVGNIIYAMAKQLMNPTICDP